MPPVFIRKLGAEAGLGWAALFLSPPGWTPAPHLTLTTFNSARLFLKDNGHSHFFPQPCFVILYSRLSISINPLLVTYFLNEWYNDLHVPFCVSVSTLVQVLSVSVCCPTKGDSEGDFLLFSVIAKRSFIVYSGDWVLRWCHWYSFKKNKKRTL